MKNTKVISAFPGTGKTYCYNKLKELGIEILDSDSSEFRWIKDENGNNTTKRNPDFPNNTISKESKVEGMREDKEHQRIELYGNQTISDIFKYGYCGAISNEECSSFVAHNGCDVIGCNIECEWCDHVSELLID